MTLKVIRYLLTALLLISLVVGCAPVYTSSPLRTAKNHCFPDWPTGYWRPVKAENGKGPDFIVQVELLEDHSAKLHTFQPRGKYTAKGKRHQVFSLSCIEIESYLYGWVELEQGSWNFFAGEGGQTIPVDAKYAVGHLVWSGENAIDVFTLSKEKVLKMTNQLRLNTIQMGLNLLIQEPPIRLTQVIIENRGQLFGEKPVRFNRIDETMFNRILAEWGISRAKKNLIHIFIKQLDDPVHCISAIQELTKLGSAAEPSLTKLTELLRRNIVSSNDWDQKTTRLAIDALVAIGVADTEAINALAAVTNQALNESVSDAAANALTELLRKKKDSQAKADRSGYTGGPVNGIPSTKSAIE
jgi:hypothetical protein